MNDRIFYRVISSSKNLTLGMGLTVLLVTTACQAPGLSKQNQLTNNISTQTSQMIAKKSQQLKPITINLTNDNQQSTNITVSPDYQSIASMGTGNTIQIRDISTNKLTITLEGHQGSTGVMNWSPDGKILASGNSDKTIKLWDVKTGKLLQTITGYDSKTNNTYWVWSPDSKGIALVDVNKKTQIWDAKTGKLLKTLPGHENTYFPMSWSPDSQAIALSNSDTIQIWDAKTGKLLQTLKHKFTSSAAALTGFTWSPDSKKLASTSVVGTFIWDVSTGKKLQEFSELFVGAGVWSPDGKNIAVGGQEQTIKIWDVTTGKLLKTMYGHDIFVTNFAWSEDGKILISVGMDNTIKIWNATTGQRIKTLFGHSGGIFSVSWNPQTRTLVSIGREASIQNSTMKLWKVDLDNLAPDREIKEKFSLRGHKDAIHKLIWSPDSKFIASSENNNENDIIKLWDISAGKLIKNLTWTQPISFDSIVWNPHGKTLATSGREFKVNKSSSSLILPEKEIGTIKVIIWDVATGKSLQTIDVEKNENRIILNWSPDGKTLAGIGKNTIILWDYTTGKTIRTLAISNQEFSSLSWSIDGKILVASGEKEIQFWDTSTGKLINSIKEINEDLVSSHDGKTLARINKNTVELWDINTGKLIKTLVGYNSVVSSNDNSAKIKLLRNSWSRDSKFIATIDVQGILQLWDVTTGKFVQTQTSHGVSDIVWSGDNKTFASVSLDKTIKVWDISTGQEIETIGINLSHTKNVFWSPDGKKIVAGEWFSQDNNQRIQIWDINFGH